MVGDRLWRRVGREPPASVHSIIQLELENGTPRNPFINGGAIAVTDVILAGRPPRDALAEILRFVRFIAEDDTIYIDKSVAQSEKETAFEISRWPNFMRSFGVNRKPGGLPAGDLFPHNATIVMTCRQLASPAAIWRMTGKKSRHRLSVVSKQRARRNQRPDADLRPFTTVRANSPIASACRARAASAAALWPSRRDTPRLPSGRPVSTPWAIPTSAAWRWKGLAQKMKWSIFGP